MPITVTRYKCDKCLYLHSTFSDALNCESLPLMGTAPPPIGSLCTFEQESGGLNAMRWSYGTESGTVTDHIIERVSENGQAFHIVTAVVSAVTRFGTHDHLVRDGRCPYDAVYPSGFFAKFKMGACL